MYFFLLIRLSIPIIMELRFFHENELLIAYQESDKHTPIQEIYAVEIDCFCKIENEERKGYPLLCNREINTPSVKVKIDDDRCDKVLRSIALDNISKTAPASLVFTGEVDGCQFYFF